MKKNLKYTVNKDTIYVNGDGLMAFRTQHVTFNKKVKAKEEKFGLRLSPIYC